jgi:mRNA guanylyltransferase
MGASVDLRQIGTLMQRQDVQYHKDAIADLLKRNNTNFPGAQPVSFARRHLLELQRNDYFLCEKTDGIRCLLYLTQIFQDPHNPIEAQFLIDRKNDYYYIAPGYLHIPLVNKRPNEPAFDIHSYHNGTLLDGELVRQRFPDGREQLTYLIFDCLALCGDSIIEKRYDSRIGSLKQFVYEPWKAFAQAWPDEAKVQPFQLGLKEWQVAYVADFMFDQIIPKLPHVNDGLIFTCKSTPYVTGTDQHILKWKPPHENTVDFRLQLGAFPKYTDGMGRAHEDYDQKPDMDLLVFHGGNNYKHFAALSVTQAEWTAMKGMGQKLDWRIIECYRDSTTGQWRPKIEGDGTPRFRDDKQHANHHTVVDSVIESIEDGVTEQDLFASKEKIRAAWKEREKKAREMKQGARPTS